MQVAKYFYAAKNTDELSLKPGDEVTLSQDPAGGWWEGTCNGVTGTLKICVITTHVLGHRMVSE